MNKIFVLLLSLALLIPASFLGLSIYNIEVPPEEVNTCFTLDANQFEEGSEKDIRAFIVAENDTTGNMSILVTEACSDFGCFFVSGPVSFRELRNYRRTRIDCEKLN